MSSSPRRKYSLKNVCAPVTARGDFKSRCACAAKPAPVSCLASAAASSMSSGVVFQRKYDSRIASS